MHGWVGAVLVVERKGTVVMTRHAGMLKSVEIHRFHSASTPAFDENAEFSEEDT